MFGLYERDFHASLKQVVNLTFHHTLEKLSFDRMGLNRSCFALKRGLPGISSLGQRVMVVV